MRREVASAVLGHRPAHSFERAQLGPERRLELRRHLRREPGGEGLVQPDVVPPRRRDEVPEPLVRELVGVDAEEALAQRGRRRVADQQQPLLVDDEPRVLHRAEREVGRGDEVELVEGVGDAEPRLERGEDARRLGERVRQLAAATVHGEAAQRERAAALRRRRDRRRLDDVPRPDRVRDQIGRQRLGGRERHAAPSLRGGLLAQHARVRSRDRLRGNHERHVPRRLERRLVEAGEALARGERLELRRHVGALVDGDLVCGVELRGVARAEGEHELELARRQRPLGRERQHAALVHRLRAQRDRRRARRRGARAHDLEVLAVEEDRSRRLRAAHRDPHLTVEARPPPGRSRA